jgi:hypothetical protein
LARAIFVFLTLEVRVEGAAGVTGECGDIFQARGFESVAGENAFGGEQTPARRGAGLLARGGRFGSSRAKGRTERVVPDDQARAAPLPHFYVHVYLFKDRIQ